MGADIYYDGPKHQVEGRLWEAYQAVKNQEAKEKMYLLWKQSRDQLDEDYFRDSYNNSSVFWQMGLSWWADVGKSLNEEGRLPIAKAKKLRKYIEKHPIIKEEIKFKAFGSEEIEPLTDKELDEWFEYFVSKRQTFLDMLDRSIDNKSPLICSV